MAAIKPSAAVALVVVHGMGNQRRGETLYEWAEPILHRIRWISQEEQGLEGLVFDEAEAGADVLDRIQARVQLRGKSGPTWVAVEISEARWSESFLAMQRGEVFNWAVGFVWRAAIRLGASWTRMIWLLVWRASWWLRRVNNARTPAFVLRVIPLAVLAGAWLVAVVVASILIAATWVGLFVLAAALTPLLPLVSVFLLFPWFSSWLQPVVDTLVEFVGDLAVWTRRPARAAAMRAVVHTALVETRARLGKSGVPKKNRRLVVLAHSQGAAITAQTLFGDRTGTPGAADAFVSVGAAITLLGASRWESTDGVLPVRAFLAGVGRYGGHRVSVSDPLITDFNPVEAWSEHHSTVKWLNFWGTWDPASAGPISTDPAGRNARWRLSYSATVPASAAPARGPEEHPVHNNASPFKDHQTYPANVGQVIDPVVRLLLGSIGASPPEASATRSNALHVRSVKDLGLNRVIIIGLAIAAVLLPSTFYVAIANRVWQVIAFLFNLDVDKLDSNWLHSQPLFVPVVALVVYVVTGFWINSALWRRYLSRVDWLVVPPGRYGVWWSGLVLRAALLAVLLALGFFYLALPLWAAIIAVAAAAVLVAGYRLVTPPRVVKANPRN